MEPEHKSNRKKIILIIVSIILGGILITLSTLVLVIHSYIRKINFDTTSDQVVVSAGDIETGMDHASTDSNSENYNSSDKATGSKTDQVSSSESAMTTNSEADQPSIYAYPGSVYLHGTVGGNSIIEEDYPKEPKVEVNEITILENEIRRNIQENSTPVKYDKNVYNVLLIGSDTREVGGYGRSDAMILVSINKKTKKITATSLLRDIYLSIPGKKNNYRINTAYAFGGADLLMDTVEQNFKVRVDQYISIDFFSFIDIVDAVGGVTLDVSEKEIPVINGYIHEINRLTGQKQQMDTLTKPGKLLLNGKQALGYARNRYVGNSDFERTARQRRVLEQIFQKVKDLNIIQLTNLLDVILPKVTTNMSEGEIFSFLLNMPSYIKYDLDQWSIPMKGTYKSMKISGADVLGINFAENIKELQSRLYGID